MRNTLPLILLLLVSVTVITGCKKQREKKANYSITFTGDKNETREGKARMYFDQQNFFGVKIQDLSVELVGEGTNHITMEFLNDNDSEVLLERKFFVDGLSSYYVSISAVVDGQQYSVDSGLSGFVELTRATNTHVDGELTFTLTNGVESFQVTGNFEAYDY